MKYVACYCRVSTDEQVKFGFSIQAQKEALEKYCKEHKYKYEFYIDEGVSASSMKRRKALNQMLNKANLFDMVLFTKLDRLSRNVLDANNINKLLQDNNCTMKAIDEDDIDTSTADGTFIFNLKVSLAQREIGKTSERIKFIFKSKRDRGEITSGSKKYGYDISNRHYVINKTEAQNIINLYNYFINCNGDIQKTYKYFIHNFSGKGHDAMINYLKDTAYIGKYKLYRKNEYLDNYIPRIMEDNLFYKVQNLFTKKQNHTSENKTAIFAGLIYCSTCKNKMIKKQDNRVKSKLIRYSCYHVFSYKVGSTERKCTNTTLIRESIIEDYLLNNLCKKYEEYKINSKIKKELTELLDPDKIEKIELKIEKLKDLYLDNLIDKETYKKDYDKYTKELESLKNTTTVYVTRDLSHVEKILNSNYKEIYSKLTPENKRRFWLYFIDKIYVKDGKIEKVTFL